jgi:hypothetical protein
LTGWTLLSRTTDEIETCRRRIRARFVTGPYGITETTTTRFVADSSGTVTDRLGEACLMLCP